MLHLAPFLFLIQHTVHPHIGRFKTVLRFGQRRADTPAEQLIGTRNLNFQDVPQLINPGTDLICIRNRIQKYDKLVPANPPCISTILLGKFFQDAPGLLKHKIPGIVAIGVVDLLEIIHVDDEHEPRSELRLPIR